MNILIALNNVVTLMFQTPTCSKCGAQVLHNQRTHFWRDSDLAGIAWRFHRASASITSCRGICRVSASRFSWVRVG